MRPIIHVRADGVFIWVRLQRAWEVTYHTCIWHQAILLVPRLETGMRLAHSHALHSRRAQSCLVAVYDPLDSNVGVLERCKRTIQSRLCSRAPPDACWTPT